MERAKPKKLLKTLYSRKDFADAEEIRSKALNTINLDSSTDDTSNASEMECDDDCPKEDEAHNSRTSNPKKDLVKYLEKKSENEIKLRKEEIRIREKEAENKTSELEILRLKTNAEIEERKKFNELLVKLITKE